MSRARKRTKKSVQSTAPRAVVQEALQVTWLLKGNLKNAQLAYLRVGALLVRVRDEKLYAALGHADIESYAEQRLHLGRASLYRYIQVHDWIAQCHPEWLKPKPKGFIPDLSDAANLIWIEGELAKSGLDPKRKAALEELRKKALDGRLGQGELNAFRRQGQKGKSGLKSFLSKLRLLRRRGSELDDMPSEVLTALDSAIELLKNDHALTLAGIGNLGQFGTEKRGFLLA